MKKKDIISLEIDGRSVTASPDETVASVLLSQGCLIFRHNERNEPRGIYCGMGICFECLVSINGIDDIRACVTKVQEGMKILTGGGFRDGCL